MAALGDAASTSQSNTTAPQLMDSGLVVKKSGLVFPVKLDTHIRNFEKLIESVSLRRHVVTFNLIKIYVFLVMLNDIYLFPG